MIYYLIACCLILAGLVIRLIAMRTLGSCFSMSLRMPTVIVTEGLYRYIRHPAYLGSLLIFAGVAIVSIYIAFFWLTISFFLSRAVQEEQILLMHSDYPAYRARTGMFFPKLRFRHGDIHSSTNGA